MKKISLITLLLSLAILNLPQAFAQKKNLNYQEAYGKKRPKVTKPLPRITGWLDDTYYLENKKVDDKSTIVKVDATSGKELVYFDFSKQNKNLPEAL